MQNRGVLEHAMNENLGAGTVSAQRGPTVRTVATSLRREGPFAKGLSPMWVSFALLLTVLMVASGLSPTAQAQAQASGSVPSVGELVPVPAGTPGPLTSGAGWHSYPHLSILLPPGVTHPGTLGLHLQPRSKVVFRGETTPTNAFGSDAPQVSAVPSLPSPQLITNGTYGWTGIPGVSPNPCGCAPPDTNNGEGNGYVVESVNAYWEVWSTTGTFVSGNTLDNLFGTGTDFLSDPQTWYDPLSGQWFQSIIDIQNYVGTGSCSPNCPIDVAVSATGNPSGTWYQYQILDSAGILPDQPQIGTDSTGFFVSVNDFGSGTTHIFELNKSQMLSGAPSPAEWDTTGPGNLGYGSLHPAHTESASNTEYFMGDDFGGVTTLNMLSIKGAPPSVGKVTWQNFTTTEGAVGCLTVPGGGGMCQIDGRLLGLAFWQGTLWGSATDGCTSGDCSHFWEVDTQTSPWTMVSDFTWNPPSDTTYYSNLAIGPAGSVGIVFSYSSGTDYPGVGITGRSPADAPGTLETPIFVKPGYAVGSASLRYGDYSGAAYDQATGKFWVSGEWIPAGSATGTYTAWATWVQSFSMGGFFAIGAANPNPTDVSIQVSFNGTEFGGTTPITYAWTFGDRAPSSGAQNPTHVYNTTGNFTVHFWANETSGLARSREANMTVVVNPLPTETLAATPNPTDVGLPVDFAPTVTGGTPGFTYAWNFGDGTVGTGVAPSHTYTAAGTYAVAGWANDSAGGSATATLSVAVNPDPSVGFVATPSPSDAGNVVSFASTASGGTGGLTLTWLFGDGTGGSGASPTHTYASRGNYTARAWANDSLGESGNYSLNMSVGPALNLLLVDATPLALDVGRPVSFSASYWGGTPSYSESWSFGDGARSTAPTPTHSYGSAGAFHVGFWLNDSGGGSLSAGLTIQVNPAPLVTSFQGVWPGTAVDQLDLGQALDLQATIRGGTGSDSFAYSGLPAGCSTWDQATLFCTPAVTGNFTAHLEVTDASGVHAYANLSFAVNPDPIVVDFSASPDLFTFGGSTTLSVVAKLGTPGYTYAYPVLPQGCQSTDAATVRCTPSVSGEVTVEVSVSDLTKMSVSAQQTFMVDPTLAIVSFTATPSSVHPGDPVSLQVVVSGGTAPYTYTYTGLPSGCGLSGNGGTCSPSSTGSYSIHVKVTDSDGQTQAASLSLSVNPPASQLGSGLFSLGTLWALLLLLIVVVLVVILAVSLRRRHGEGPSASEPSTEAHVGGPNAWADANAAEVAPSPEGHDYPSEPAPNPDWEAQPEGPAPRQPPLPPPTTEPSGYGTPPPPPPPEAPHEGGGT